MINYNIYFAIKTCTKNRSMICMNMYKLHLIGWELFLNHILIIFILLVMIRAIFISNGITETFNTWLCFVEILVRLESLQAYVYWVNLVPDHIFDVHVLTRLTTCQWYTSPQSFFPFVFLCGLFSHWFCKKSTLFLPWIVVWQKHLHHNGFGLGSGFVPL